MFNLSRQAMTRISKTGTKFLAALAIIFTWVFVSFNTQAGKLPDGLNLIHPGMTIGQVEEILGEPGRLKQVQRHIFNNWGQVVVTNEKINDIRIDGKPEEQTPLMARQASEDDPDINKLRFLRIGTPDESIAKIAGAPDAIVEGTDLFYHRNSVIIEADNGVVTRIHTGRDTGLSRIDWVKLNFSATSLLIMNITIAFIMFGVALEIKPENFKLVLKEPKSLILGIFSQFLALPALTFLLIYFIKPTPTVALGMILVAACPGGNVSNFMTSLAKGNVALSISLTAFSTISAIFMTPVNFAFWGKLYSETSNMVIPIEIDFFEIFRTVMLLLGLPVVLGIWFSKTFSALTQKIVKPIKTFSMVFFLVFIVFAFLGNVNFFMSYIHLIMFIVLAHNALALITGFIISTLGRTPKPDRRSITIETGIQNSGLGLVLIFNPRLFDGLGGMAFIAAWWGIWHIISGLTLSYLWSRKPLPAEVLTPMEVNSKA